MAGSEIRIAIVGLGNCASTLVQGITHYRRGAEPVGLMHPVLGGMGVGDIHIACAFDVDARKVGRRVGEAIFGLPNNSRIFCRDPEDDGAMVHAGPVLDGLAGHLGQFDEAKRAVLAKQAGGKGISDVVKVLKKTGATMLINYLPVGSQRATEMYTEAALKAGIGMVNCIPVFIGSDAKWRRNSARRACRLSVMM